MILGSAVGPAGAAGLAGGGGLRSVRLHAVGAGAAHKLEAVALGVVFEGACRGWW